MIVLSTGTFLSTWRPSNTDKGWDFGERSREVTYPVSFRGFIQDPSLSRPLSDILSMHRKHTSRRLMPACQNVRLCMISWRFHKSQNGSQLIAELRRAMISRDWRSYGLSVNSKRRIRHSTTDSERSFEDRAQASDASSMSCTQSLAQLALRRICYPGTERTFRNRDCQRP
jgi:hypothetical protein